MKTLKRDVKRLMSGLKDLGFGDNDADIDGADTVDLVNKYLSTIKKLPDLLALRDAVALSLEKSHHYYTEGDKRNLVAAYEKVK
jgi:hypothetical protein